LRHVDTSKLAPGECAGIQIYGLSHCAAINCRWQGLSACQGQQILTTGKNAKGWTIGPDGLAEHETTTNKNKEK